MYTGSTGQKKQIFPDFVSFNELVLEWNVFKIRIVWLRFRYVRTNGYGADLFNYVRVAILSKT